MHRFLSILFLSLSMVVAASADEAVTGRVILSPELADRASPDHTVFVFARAAEGPPMPLAVMRVRVSDLPLKYRLDDSMAMTPTARLSGFDAVYIIARVSAAGSAQARSGDLEGASEVIVPGTGNVDVVIDRVLQ